MDIMKIERRTDLILNAAKNIGDEATVLAANEAAFIIAEVRHYCKSLMSTSVAHHEEAGKNLCQALQKRYVEQRT